MALRVDYITGKGRKYKAVFFSASWTEETLYVPKRYVIVLSEGSPSEFFENNPPSPSSSQGSSGGLDMTAPDDEDEEQIDEVVFCPTGSHAEDILLVRNQGLEVDDDNEPAL